ncbi:hypothetical protein ACIPIC_07990 [Streptomyces collinus]|uniref:hypothetical protein n=1 Tax=Streptomyces collinus TaxID=42684 RepID=UPI00380AE3F1
MSTSTSNSWRLGFDASWTHLPSRSLSSFHVIVAPFAATSSSAFLSASGVCPGAVSGASGPLDAGSESGVRSQALEARAAGTYFSSSATLGRHKPVRSASRPLSCTRASARTAHEEPLPSTTSVTSSRTEPARR